MTRHDLPSPYAAALLGLTALLAVAAAVVAGMPAVERADLSDALVWLRAPDIAPR